MLPIFTSAPGVVKKDEELDPSNAANFRVRLHWCPLSFAEEFVHIFI